MGVYNKLEVLLKELHGRLEYVKEDQKWMVSVPGYHPKMFHCDGRGGVMQLDKLFVLKDRSAHRISYPPVADDYTNELVPDAREQLLAMLKPKLKPK